MKPHPPRLPSVVLRELDGLPWSWQRGSRHWRLMIDGAQVAVIGKQIDTGDPRTIDNLRSYVRRHRRTVVQRTPTVGSTVAGLVGPKP